MARQLSFRILNVFSIPGHRLSGNPLCVFEDGTGLSDTDMQALALQFNLSETTFLLPPTKEGATARVRIFTPGYEMPFAGHPTLGTAHVVRALRGGDRVGLEMKAGLVDVRAAENRWTLKAARAPTTRKPAASPAEIAGALGVGELAGPPLFVDVGAEQLVIPLATEADVRRVKPSAAGLAKLETRDAYVWAPKTATGDEIAARFFFEQRGSLVEDPATGSACANLGGYLLSTGRAPVPSRRVWQGDQVGRPSLLELRVDDAGIFVSGEVIELARGTLDL